MFIKIALSAIIAIVALGISSYEEGIASPAAPPPGKPVVSPACRPNVLYGVPSRSADCRGGFARVGPGSEAGRLPPSSPFASPGSTERSHITSATDQGGRASLLSTSSTVRVSVDGAGNEGNNFSCCPAMSGDGRYVAFESSATNLVPGDTNNRADIFVRDNETQTTTRVTLDSLGNQANDDSFYASMSADGRFVAFTSFATNLVPGDTAICGPSPFAFNCPDVFVRDRQVGTTERVSVSSTATQGNGESYWPVISGNGRHVAFFSFASTLVAGDGNNFCDNDGDGFFTENCADVFLRDRQTGTTTIASLGSGGVQGNGESYYPAISGDGRYVAFTTLARNLVASDNNYSCAIYGPIPDDNCPDVLVRDLQTGSTSRVSIATAGGEGNEASLLPAISADGRYVAFNSFATNLVSGDTNNQCDNNYDGFHMENCTDIFVHDRQTATTSRISVSTSGGQSNSESYFAQLSSDGRFIGFYSYASNLVSGDTNNFCDNNFDEVYIENCSDAFVYDRQSGTTARVSLGTDGAQANDLSFGSVPSGNGRYVAFTSAAANLVPGDTNLCDVDFDPAADPCPDAFRRDLGDSNGDGTPDPFDSSTDSDGDLLSNLTEAKCGSNPLNAVSMPERIDTPGDDDGDTLVNEGLPAGAEAYDCDGDGFPGSTEKYVFSAASTVSDQKRCGVNAWPADINNDGFVDILGDISAVTNYFGQPVPPAPVRYNIAPDGFIDILGDISRMTGVFGQSCAQ